jgi:hypothetical protein
VVNLVKLERDDDPNFVRQVFLQDESLYASDLLVEYLSKANFQRIETELLVMIRQFKISQ